MKKRILSLLLVSIMLLTMLPAGVLAADGQEEVPDLGLYTSQSLNASTLVEDITIDADHNVFYIALRPDLVTNGYKMTAVSKTFGDEITDTNLTEIATVDLSADGSYATVTVTDLTAEGPYHFEATVQGPENSGGTWGRSIWINNDMPRLYFRELVHKNGSWTVDDTARSDWWCCPGISRYACFYFGSKSEVEAGTCKPLSMDDLSFPDYMDADDFDEPECEVKNALEVRTTRFANGKESTDIIYEYKGTEYTISAKPELPDFGFYTQPAASERAYIYDENPFVVTKTNRTFYLCTNDPKRDQLTGITGWDDPDSAKLFEVTPCTDDNVTYLKITVKDDVIVSNGYFGAEISYRYKRDDNTWQGDTAGAAVFLENGQPVLMYRRLEWDDEEQEWNVPKRRPLETLLTLSAGDSFPVQFYYGTNKKNTAVKLSDLTFPTDILRVYTEDGAAWVEGTSFEESGTISYTSEDGGTATMQVNVTQPDFGFYSSTAPSKATYLGEEVAVSGSNDAFYIVAGQDRTIPGIEAIENNQTGEDATDRFAVTIDQNGGYACIQMKRDTNGNLPAGGDYTVLIEQDWGTRYLHFKLIRNDLLQLSTPTDLTWHRQYQWWDAQAATDYEDRMGAMSFKVGELVQNRFSVEIYSAADGYTSPVASGRWRSGDMDHSDYFTLTNFIYEELPSGTYKFRVRADGDGTKYRDSEWSAMSPEFQYTEPKPQLTAPDKDSFEWRKGENGYFAAWAASGETGAGYYEVHWYYRDAVTGRLKRAGGDLDIAVEDAYEEARLHDGILEEHGAVPYYFKVRVIPADITQYRISEWSDFSEALDTQTVTNRVNQELDDLLSKKLDVEDVQDALEEQTGDLHTAMAADLELSGGASSGTLEKIRKLESKVADSVTQGIKAKNNAPQQIKDIVGGITMIGATLNLADKHPESGTKPTVTLELDEPKSGVVIAEQQHNAVQFSMKLNGAVDKDDKEKAGQQLIVPVVIDMPVPAGINPDFLVVLHKLWDGTIEQIRPYIYWNESSHCRHARFVINSFSDFALVEYNFRFEADSVTRVLGDTPFAMAATGNAEGSSVTYSSSDSSVAKVNPETGRVTMLKAGAVTITATAAATEVYPEAQASYVLTVTASNASRPSVSVPSTSKIQVEQPQNGAVSLSSNSAAKGDTVTITVMPDKGYTLETLTVTDENGKSVPVRNNGDGTYSFTQPAGKVTITATFMEDNSMLNFFVDVPASAYYYDAVLWAAENGITGGTGDGLTFSPNASCTRAQAVTFLWRAAGCPEPETMSSFADASADSYYAKAVAWAVENGITKGTGDGTTFSPNATCTRGQIMTFLWRAQKSPAAAGANSFTDMAADSYCANAVQWAVENGITNGTGDGTTFSPNNNCTRAQIVTFLYRFFVK